MLGCRTECKGSFSLQEGLPTRDGKKTWNVVCAAGIQGGCSGPTYEQAIELSQVAGRDHGAQPRQRPLAISATLGQLTRTWRLPTLGRVYPSDVTLRK